MRRRLGIGPDDDFPPENPDDPYDPITRMYEEAGEMDAQARRGSHMVRKAFLIALFHLWERHRNGVSLRQFGSSIKDALDDLEGAANCAKHPPGRSAEKIYGRRPDLFPRAAKVEQAGERTLVITAETLNEFFEVIYTVAEKQRTVRSLSRTEAR